MKIGHIDNSAAVTPVGERQGGAAPAKAGNGQAEASTQVELSSTAAMLVDGGGADFDADKVKRIAQAIRDGQFEVNAEAIADKLIANAQEVLGKAAH